MIKAAESGWSYSSNEVSHVCIVHLAYSKEHIIYLLDKSNACNLLTAHVHTIDKWTFEKVMQAENNKLIIMIIYYATNTT